MEVAKKLGINENLVFKKELIDNTYRNHFLAKVVFFIVLCFEWLLDLFL